MPILSGTFSTWLRTSSSSLILLCLLFIATALSGCSEGGGQAGRWQGRVAAVDVYDHDGNTYPAAALLIDRGPAYRPVGPAAYVLGSKQDQNLPESVGGGSAPLLIEGDPPRIIPRDRLPVGKRISVQGSMTAEIVFSPVQTPYSDHAVARYSNGLGKTVGAEHGIYVKRYELLKE